jgi:hypothetical protein
MRSSVVLALLIMPLQPTQSLKVGVIGSGAAGLAATRVLTRQGIRPIVLEKDTEPGGVWRHIPGVKTRPMYQGLRTNLPRELMAFREKPWGSGPGKSYVTHKEVLDYLTEYRDHFGLDQYISYNSTVTHLTVLTDSSTEWPKIRLTWERDQSTTTEVFDAVMICNGHYAQPSSPDVLGLDKFPGRVMHSVEYDDPSEFSGQAVLCIGARASGSDLAREISQHARHVYLSDSTATETKTLGNLSWVPRTVSVVDETCVQFSHDCPLTPTVDVIVFCSGYDYSFPFINGESNLELELGQRRVKPLYKQLWHAQCPSVTFLGLPHSIVPFPLFELQSEAILAQLLDRTSFPRLEKRMEAANRDAQAGGFKETGRVVDTHFLGSGQWDYCRDMAKMAGLYNTKMEKYISTNKVRPVFV